MKNKLLRSFWFIISFFKITFSQDQDLKIDLLKKCNDVLVQYMEVKSKENLFEKYDLLSCELSKFVDYEKYEIEYSLNFKKCTLRLIQGQGNLKIHKNYPICEKNTSNDNKEKKNNQIDIFPFSFENLNSNALLFKSKKAVCFLKNGEIEGTVTFHQKSPFDSINVSWMISGLKNNSRYVFYIHEFGNISGDCSFTGDNYKPHQIRRAGPESAQRYFGDLGNFITDDKGQTSNKASQTIVTLFGELSVIGRSVVLHEKGDDLEKGNIEVSSKTVNFGKKIACCVIGLSE